MANAAGKLRKLIIGGFSWSFPDDNDVTFYSGGDVPSEILVRNQGTTPQITFKPGRISGAQIDTSHSGSYNNFKDHVLDVCAKGNTVAVQIEAANGDTYGGDAYVTVSDDGPRNFSTEVLSVDVIASTTFEKIG